MLIVLILEIEALYETIPEQAANAKKVEPTLSYTESKTNFIAFKWIEVIHIEPGYISWLLLQAITSYEREKYKYKHWDQANS